MDKIKKHNLKSVVTVVLSVMLAISLIMTVACSTTPSSDENTSSSSSSSSGNSATMTDYQAISNGDFEYRHDNATSFPVSSSIGWSRSNDSLGTTAVSSTKSSGIINTKDDGDFDYKAFAKSNGLPVISGEGDNAVYFNPRTPEALGLVKAEDLYDYSEYERNKIVNDDKLPTSGDHVLMIHNASASGNGTAQKFTSSTTITVEKYGKISAWVLTKDLTSKMENGDFGAYISLINTINTPVNPVIVKNIDTDGKWQKFEFCLDASDYTTSTFRVVLGLGFGSKEVQSEYVEGFAFFDNVYYEDITASEYAENVAKANAVNLSAYSVGSKTVDTYVYEPATQDFSDVQITVDGRNDAEHLKISYTDLNATSTITEGENTANVYTVTLSHTKATENFSLDGSDKIFKTNEELFVNTTSQAYAMDVTSGLSAFNAIDNAKIQGVVNPLGNDAETLYLIHNNGASSKVTIKNDDFFVFDGTCLYITFLVKVKNGNGQEGVAVKLIDLGSKKTEIEETVSMLASVSTNGIVDEETSDWARVNLFITNFKGDKFERKFALEVDFGPTTVVQKQMLLTEGYALMTGFEATLLDQEEYNITSRNGNFDAAASLGAEIVNPVDDSVKPDNYAINCSAASAMKIQNTVASSIVNYTGTVGNGKLVGGTDTATTSDKVVAGLINTNYTDNYTQLDATAKANVALLTPDEGNTYVQPIIINNKEATSYGYVTSGYTISANSATLVSVKLRVFGDAVANVYLTDSDPLTSFAVLGIEGKSVNRDGNKPVYGETPEVSEKFTATVTAADCDNDWVTVNFVITAGKSAIPYRIEIFNGSRDGQTTCTGLVAIDSVTVDSSVKLDEFKAKLLYDFDESDDDVHKNYKGVVKTVQYTDEDGKDAIKYTSDANEVEVYTFYKNALTTIATYENIDVETEIDERIPEEEDSSDNGKETDPDREANYSLVLQITSIILSVVLIAVLLIVVFRQLLKRMKKENAAEIYYNRSSRDKSQDQINANKAKRKAAVKEREEIGYDDDGANENAVDEETADEAEEVSDEAEAEAGSEAVDDNEEKPE